MTRLGLALVLGSLALGAGCAQSMGDVHAVNPGVPVTGTDIPVSASIRTDTRPVDPALGCSNEVVVMNGAPVPRGPACAPPAR